MRILPDATAKVRTGLAAAAADPAGEIATPPGSAGAPPTEDDFGRPLQKALSELASGWGTGAPGGARPRAPALPRTVLEIGGLESRVDRAGARPSHPRMVPVESRRPPADAAPSAQLDDGPTPAAPTPAERSADVSGSPLAPACSILALATSLGSWIATSARDARGSLAAGAPSSGHSTPASAEATLPVPALPEASTIHALAQRATAQTARVEVQHPELGAILLDVCLDRGSLEVRAVTTCAATALTLSASESALRESVALAGVELRSLRVDRRGDPENERRRAREAARRRHLDTEA